jgi:hypothetical protein
MPSQRKENKKYSKDSLRPKAFFISVHAGVSIPVSAFGKKDTTANFMILTNTNSSNAVGFAKTGINLSAKGGYSISENFGVLAKVGYNYNAYDANTLNTILNGTYYYTLSGNYNIWQFMGGGFASYQPNPATTLRFEAMGGGIVANYPNFLASIGGVETLSGSLAQAHDFAYSFAICIDQAINQTVSFTGTISYTGALLTYPTSSYTLASGSVSTSYVQHTPISMPYGSIDFSIGFMFHL